MDLEKIKIILDIIATIITIVGAPIAAFLYFKEKRSERLEREYGTYNALDDKYIDFLNLCLNNTDLGIYEMSEKKESKLTKEQIIRRNIIFENLLCLFERAYLMYSEQNTNIRKKQWIGWNSFMEDWMENKSFRETWRKHLNTQYDIDFQNHMNLIYKRKSI